MLGALSPEDQDARIEWSNHEPMTFAMLVQWMYQEKLPSAENLIGAEAVSSFRTHIALYHLAVEIHSPTLQDEVMQQLRALYIKIRREDPIESAAIIEIYRVTDSKSLLRQFVCDAAAKAFLDCARADPAAYEEAFAIASGFTAQFSKALHEYHHAPNDIIKDDSDRYMLCIKEKA